MTPSAFRALAFGGFLVAGLTGWKLAAPELPSFTSSPSSINTRPSSSRTRQAETSGPPAWARASVAAILQAAGPEDRLRRILALANAVPISEIPKWLDGRWLPGEGFEPTFLTELLIKRWESADPLAVARWQIQTNPQQAEPILMRFANTDPEAVIALLKGRPSGYIEINVLSEMAKNHPDIAWDRFMNLVSRDLGNSATETNTTSFLHAMAKTHPAMLEAALGPLPAFWNSRAKDALVGQRLMDHFDEEIRKLWNAPDGWMRFSNNLSVDGMADKLFGELPNLPASWRQSIADGDWFIWKDTGKWWRADLEGSGFTPEQARKIRMTALVGMSRNNPEATIVSMDGIELSADERTNLLQNIFLRAQVTPGESARLLKLLPTAEDREAARAISDRKTTFVPLPAIMDPTEWLTAFGNADPKSSKFHQYRNMTRLWEPEKIEELATCIRSLPEDRKLKVAGLFKSQSCDYSSDDQPLFHGETLRCLAAHPDQFPDLVQSTSTHAVKWAQKDPAAASEWVLSLPNGEARQWAEKNLTAYWVQVDPDAARQWFRSLPNGTLETQPEKKR